MRPSSGGQFIVVKGGIEGYEKVGGELLLVATTGAEIVSRFRHSGGRDERLAVGRELVSVDVDGPEIAGLVPELADRVDTIRDWNDVHFLSVESSRIPTWHREGLLAIGDAAHVMSPVAGVGINYAIQDAVAAANLLSEPLLAGNLTDAHLAAVQRRREFPTRFIQGFQGVVQRTMVARALEDKPFRLPLPARIISALPLLRNLPARLIGWGIRPERVQLSAVKS